MSKIILKTEYLLQLEDLDKEIRSINERKIRLLFEALGVPITEGDFTAMLDWELIALTVPDKQMSVQLNKLSAYIPNLLFVVDPGPIFTVVQGAKKRRVWKNR